MAARAFMEQVRTVILQRRVRETQSRSEPAGVFQSLIAHIMERDADSCLAVARSGGKGYYLRQIYDQYG
jgi:hypothetical protein